MKEKITAPAIRNQCSTFADAPATAAPADARKKPKKKKKKKAPPLAADIGAPDAALDGADAVAEELRPLTGSRSRTASSETRFRRGAPATRRVGSASSLPRVMYVRVACRVDAVWRATLCVRRPAAAFGSLFARPSPRQPQGLASP